MFQPDDAHALANGLCGIEWNDLPEEYWEYLRSKNRRLVVEGWTSKNIWLRSAEDTLFTIPREVVDEICVIASQMDRYSPLTTGTRAETSRVDQPVTRSGGSVG